MVIAFLYNVNVVGRFRFTPVIHPFLAMLIAGLCSSLSHGVFVNCCAFLFFPAIASAPFSVQYSFIIN